MPNTYADERVVSSGDENPEYVTKAPYWRVWIKNRPALSGTGASDKTRQGVGDERKKGAEGAELQIYENSLNASIEEITVEETMLNADKFTIKIFDPDMTVMFDQNLYIGQLVFANIGHLHKYTTKIDGFINKMSFKFPQDGIPRLVIEGFAINWDALNKHKLMWDVKVDARLPDQPGTERFDPKKGRGTVASIREMLDRIVEVNGLKIIWGATVPVNIQEELIKSAGVTEFYQILASGNMTTLEFLHKFADKHGCYIFVKGRYLHMYPPAFVDSPAHGREDYDSQALKLERDIEALEKLTPIPKETIAAKKKEIIRLKKKSKDATPAIETIKGAYEGSKTLWYKMDNQLEGQAGTGYNLLSFEPQLQNLNVAGYLGMSIDPETGDISMGHTLTKKTQEDAATSARRRRSALKENKEFVAKTGLETGFADGEKLRDDIILQGGIATPEQQNSSMKQASVATTGEAARSDSEMQSLANFNFRRSMWFTSASATAIGDVDYTVGMPVFIFGFGTRESLQAGKHESKICGKWYIKSVTHKLKKKTAYLCEFKLQRWMQFPAGMDPDKHLDSAKGPSVPEVYLGVNDGVSSVVGESPG